MLLEMTIENFILIDRETVYFNEGLNIITGETGAGKSIVLGALEAVFGGRLDKSVIRNGRSTALIQALLDISHCPQALSYLSTIGQESDDGLITLSREIKQEGKSVSRINGRAVTTGIVKELSSVLFEMTGQHDQQQMLQPKYQMALLDSFIGDSITPYKTTLKTLHHEISTLQESLNALDMSDEEARLKLDLIDFQIEEIENAAFKESDYESLEEDFRSQKHAEKIVQGLNQCRERFEAERGILNQISGALRDLSQIENYSDLLKGLHIPLESIYYDLEAYKDQVKSTLSSFENAEFDIVTLETRFNLLNHFKRKYGNSYIDLMAYLNHLMVQKENLESLSERKKQLEEQLASKQAKYHQADKHLFELRKKSTLEFDSLLLEELRALNFDNPKFVSELSLSGRISEEGSSQLNFLISTNLGEPLREMARVASGGELSRVMLAIKCLQGRRNQTPILVYDEIDTGISGKTAGLVGEKIHKTALYSQVLCVTHLPQIAVFANHHITVEKFSDQDREETFARIQVLDQQSQEIEIVRMISGEHLSDISKQNATDMLSVACKIKEKHRYEA